VEVGLECSALKSSNISEVIYCAQRVVLFPLAPLYDFTEKVKKQFNHKIIPKYIESNS